MKLQEYFDNKKEFALSDIQKMDVYYAIMDKKMKKSFHRKRSFLHIKSFVYTSFLLFFLVGFYGMYFFQQQSLEDNEGYILNRLSNTNLAQADFIAKIIDFDGSFYIEQAGKKIQTSNIKDGDLVILKQNSQVVFHIDNDTKAKITGPAKFAISKKAIGSYKVELFYGEYIEMSSLQKENKNNIELAIDGLLVSQGDNKKAIDFQFIKQGENHVIKNNGSKLLVSSENKQEKTSVGNKQVLAIQGNDISLFDDFDKFAKAIKDKNVSQTFTLLDTAKLADITETSTGSSTGEIIAKSDLKILNGEEILSIDEKDVPDIGLISDAKKVATLEQTTIIDGQLDKYFLQEILDDLVISYKESDSSKFMKQFNNLEKRISAISKAFGYEYTSINGSEQEIIQKTISTIESLSEHISEKYLLPPKYIENLKSIIPIISPLKSTPFEEVSLSEVNEEDNLS